MQVAQRVALRGSKLKARNAKQKQKPRVYLEYPGNPVTVDESKSLSHLHHDRHKYKPVGVLVLFCKRHAYQEHWQLCCTLESNLQFTCVDCC